MRRGGSPSGTNDAAELVGGAITGKREAEKMQKTDRKIELKEAPGLPGAYLLGDEGSALLEWAQKEMAAAAATASEELTAAAEGGKTGR